jgi:hypothetical protein
MPVTSTLAPGCPAVGRAVGEEAGAGTVAVALVCARGVAAGVALVDFEEPPHAAASSATAAQKESNLVMARSVTYLALVSRTA